MKRLALISTSIALLALAGQASAASTTQVTIRGAGFGHGIGLSQYGAYGYAAHGADYQSIVLHYFTGTHMGNAAGRIIRVLLQQNKNSVMVSGATQAGNHKLNSRLSYKLVRSGIDSVDLKTAAGKRIATMNGVVTVSSTSGSFALAGRALNGLSGGSYRGDLEVRTGTFGGLMAVNALPLDDYIKGVITGEMPASWPQPALEAQAVVARSYALTSDAGGAIFDQYPDQRSQMYYGMARETTGANQAVQSTAGQVVMYGNQVATTYYFSTSGGETENIENSWPGTAPVPYLRAVKDPYDYESPYHRWKQVYSKTGLDSKFGSWVKGKLKGVQVTKRGVSPRIVTANIIGSRGTVSVTGPQIRARLGLPDTWAYFVSISSGQDNAPAKPKQPSSSSGGQITDGGGTTANASSWLSRMVNPRALILSGSISPRASKIALQKKTRTGWKTLGYGTTDRNGLYRLLLASRGVYRVLANGAAGPSTRIR